MSCCQRSRGKTKPSPEAGQLFRPLEEGLGVCMSCEPIKEISGLRIPASYPCSGVHVPSTSEQGRGLHVPGTELKLHMLRHVTHRVCGFQQVGHAVVCMFQTHQSYAVVACPRHRVAQSSSCKCSDSDLLQTVHLPFCRPDLRICDVVHTFSAFRL